jgi:hypothetical protein
VALPGLRGRSARLQTNYNVTQVPYSYDDPKFESQLHKIDVYMDYLEVRSTFLFTRYRSKFKNGFSDCGRMQIQDDMCRQRFICEVASSPTAYSPLYKVFKKQLR